MKITSYKQSWQFRQADKKFHVQKIQDAIAKHGVRGLAEKLKTSPSTIVNTLKRSSYSAVVRLSEKINKMGDMGI